MQSLSVIAPYVFQTGVTSIRWQKWFMKTNQTITGNVTCLIHCLVTTARALLATALLLFLSRSRTHTHTKPYYMHSQYVCCHLFCF